MDVFDQRSVGNRHADNEVVVSPRRVPCRFTPLPVPQAQPTQLSRPPARPRDRPGVKFGLSEGRVESIMVSAPPMVAWAYNHAPEEGSVEERLLEILRKPRDWVEQ